MHFHHEILVKAEDKSQAQSIVESFLEPYGDGEVFDWFQIGGRLSLFHLDEEEREKELNSGEYVEKCDLCNGTGNRKDTEGDSCNGCRGTGRARKWPTEWPIREEDVLSVRENPERAKEIIDNQVESMENSLRDYQEMIIKEIDETGIELEDFVFGGYDRKETKITMMVGYYVEKIVKLKLGDYNSDSFFYDVHKYSENMSERRWKEILEELKENKDQDYYLVTVDLHN